MATLEITTSKSGKTKYFNVRLEDGFLVETRTKKAAMAYIEHLSQKENTNVESVQSSLRQSNQDVNRRSIFRDESGSTETVCGLGSNENGCETAHNQSEVETDRQNDDSECRTDGDRSESEFDSSLELRKKNVLSSLQQNSEFIRQTQREQHELFLDQTAIATAALELARRATSGIDTNFERGPSDTSRRLLEQETIDVEVNPF